MTRRIVTKFSDFELGDQIVNIVTAVAIAIVAWHAIFAAQDIVHRLDELELVQQSSITNLPACTAEDSSMVYPCLFDAAERGNGEGRSFIMLDGSP